MVSLPLVAAVALSWRLLQPGVEYATSGDLHIVRVDPARATLTAALASEQKTEARTAAQWCRASHLAVAINLGMYQVDGHSNVGYARHGSHLNNPRWNSDQAVLALGPGARWIDRDATAPPPPLEGYGVVVQNLRLISGDRRNVWAKNDRRWSEAAIGIDSKGRVLFLFSRPPYSMRDFNELLLRLPLDIAGAMHVEGGPEASLSIHAGGVDLDLAGSYETGFWDDSNKAQWPIPNVLGVVRAK